MLALDRGSQVAFGMVFPEVSPAAAPFRRADQFIDNKLVMIPERVAVFFEKDYVLLE